MKIIAYYLAAILCGFVSLAKPVAAESLLVIYRQARASDTDLQQVGFERSASHEFKPQARALLLPSLGAEASAVRNFNSGDFDRDFTGRDWAVVLTQPLYNRQSWTRLRQADAVIDQADADFSAAEQDLIVRVADAYFQVLARQDDLTFTLADKDAIRRQLRQAKQRYEVGLLTSTDVQEAQARLSLVEAEEVVANNEVSNSRRALAEITGELYESQHLLGDGMPLAVPAPADPKAWVANALAANPTVQSASSAVRASRHDIEVEKAEWLPKLDLVASYGGDKNDRDSTRTGRIGVQLSMNLFEGGAISSRSREAAYRHEASKAFLENRQRAVARQVQDAYRGVEAAIGRTRALAQAVAFNDSGLQATEAGFEVGTRTIVDVLNAHRDLFSARRDFSVARYDYVLSLLRLKQAAGVVNEDELAAINQWLVPPTKKNQSRQADIYRSYRQ